MSDTAVFSASAELTYGASDDNGLAVYIECPNPECERVHRPYAAKIRCACQTLFKAKCVMTDVYNVPDKADDSAESSDEQEVAQPTEPQMPDVFADDDFAPPEGYGLVV
jgi:hypothetical protein